MCRSRCCRSTPGPSQAGSSTASPCSASPHPGIAAPLEFVYVESYDDARYLDALDAVANYGILWGRLQAAALGPVESLDIIREAAAQFA
jgi:hypothetical protein